MPHEMQALIFDCDGVLVDTERDGHRVAFNEAFKAAGFSVEWSVERYGELLTTGGGKEPQIGVKAKPGPMPSREQRIEALQRMRGLSPADPAPASSPQHTPQEAAW